MPIKNNATMTNKHYQEHLDKLFYHLYKHRTLRTLFDNQSSEWDNTIMEKKEEIFDKLMSSGRPLKSWLVGYIFFYTHELANKEHVISRLPNTLLELANNLKPKYKNEILNGITWLRSQNYADLHPSLSLFKSREEVEKYLEDAYEGDDDTLKLIDRFEKLKSERQPFFLEINDFEAILKWKLRGQEGRQRKFREQNTNENVIIITKAAFSVTHENKDYETELRLKLLTVLAGVEVPVASAILTLCYPDQFSVVDFRNWRQVFPNDTNRSQYTFKDYVRYLDVIRTMADCFGVTPQQLDVAIWQKDKTLIE
jgi:hypothetical protein